MLLPCSRARLQRGGHGRACRDACTSRRPTSTCSWSTTARPTAPRSGREARRRARACACRSTSASAAPCRPASCSRTRTATTAWSRSTATASTTRTRSRRSMTAMDGDPAARHGLRLALPRPRLQVPGADQPPHRHPRLRVPALADRRPAGDATRPPGFRLYNRRGDRALRPRLPARLPRGGGRADAAPPPPAMREVPVRCSSAAAACPRSARASRPYYMIKVLLAIFVGLAAAPARRRARRRRPPWPRRTGSDGARIQIVALLAAGLLLWSCSSSSAGAGCSSATRCVWLVAALVLLGARGLARAAQPSWPPRSASLPRRTPCSSSRSGSSCCCCCTSRSRSRGSPTSRRCSPSGWRCWRSASASSRSQLRTRAGADWRTGGPARRADPVGIHERLSRCRSNSRNVAVLRGSRREMSEKTPICR